MMMRGGVAVGKPPPVGPQAPPLPGGKGHFVTEGSVVQQYQRFMRSLQKKERAGGGAGGGRAGGRVIKPGDVKGELESKSSYVQQIKNDVKTYGDMINQLAVEIRSFQGATTEDVNVSAYFRLYLQAVVNAVRSTEDLNEYILSRSGLACSVVGTGRGRGQELVNPL